MIDFEEKRNTIISLIENALKLPVVRANQTAEPPDGDYIGYTVTTPMKVNHGTYGEYVKDGVKYYGKEFQQIWSFTAHSVNDLRSKTIALKLYDFLDREGTTELSDNRIAVQRIEDITNRDNLLTTGYEYRNGFDVTFNLLNEIENGNAEVIDDFNFNYHISN